MGDEVSAKSTVSGSARLPCGPRAIPRNGLKSTSALGILT